MKTPLFIIDFLNDQNTLDISGCRMSRLPFRAVRLDWYWIFEGLNCVGLLLKFATWKIGPLSHLNGFHVFPRDNIRKTFTVMHNPVFEHSDTLSFALLTCFFCR